MVFQPVILWTDALIYLLLVLTAGMVWYTRRHEHLMQPWKRVAGSRTGQAAMVVLLFYVTVGLLDTLHFHPKSRRRRAGQANLFDRGSESVRRDCRAFAHAAREDLLGAVRDPSVQQGEHRTARWQHRARLSTPAVWRGRISTPSATAAARISWSKGLLGCDQGRGWPGCCLLFLLCRARSRRA